MSETGIGKAMATDRQAASSARRRVIWGVVLIGVGALFLLAKLDLVEIGRFRHWWPAILIGIGTVWMVAPERPRQFASGLSMVLIGFWLFACLRHWWDLTFRNAWPVVVVIYGIEMVLAALLESRRPTKEERHV
jgi:apolipoprotein N-acyltransferase